MNDLKQSIFDIIYQEAIFMENAISFDINSVKQRNMEGEFIKIVFDM